MIRFRGSVLSFRCIAINCFTPTCWWVLKLVSICPSSLLDCCGWLLGTCYDEEIVSGSPVPGAFALAGGSCRCYTFSHDLLTGTSGIEQMPPHSACSKSLGHASHVGGVLAYGGLKTSQGTPHNSTMSSHKSAVLHG